MSTATRRISAVRWLPHAAVAALTLLLGVPTLILPLHPDQALFALIGETINSGGMPYIDAWDVKTPGVFFLYALALRLPFEAMRDVRVFDLLWSAATAATLVELGRRWWGLRAGVFAGAIYAIAVETGDPWALAAQPDSLLALPVALALLLYDAGTGRRGWLIGAGLLLGVAFQLRFVAALLLPALPFIELAQAPPSERASLWLRRTAWLALGFLAAQAALVLYLAAGGALGEFVRTIEYAGWYTRQGGPWNPPGGPTLGSFLTAGRANAWGWALARVALTGPAIAGAFWGTFVARDRHVARLLIFVLLCSIGIAAQAKFFWYQFAPLVPLLALLGGWTWDRLLRALAAAQRPLVARSAAAALAAALVLGSPQVWDNAKRDWLRLAEYAGHPSRRDALLADFAAFPARRDVATAIGQRTDPGDQIYVWGFDPLLYLLSGREGASRFLVSFPLMSEWQPESWRPSFMRELERARPAYVVVQRGHAGSWVVGRDLDMAEAVADFPAFDAWLAIEYELETEIEGRLLYRRRT